MTAPAEYPYDIDLSSADDLLSGSLPWVDLPEGYEGISSLISAVRRGVAPLESGWGSPTVAAMARRISTTEGSRSAGGRRRRRLVGSVPHMAAAITAAALLSSGTAVAAAGELPAPMQVAVSDVASIVGVSVPSTDGSNRPLSRAPSGPPATFHVPAIANTSPSASPASTPPVSVHSPSGQTPILIEPAGLGTTPPPSGPDSTATTVPTPPTSLPTTPSTAQVSQPHGSPPGSNSGRGLGPGSQGGHSSGG